MRSTTLGAKGLETVEGKDILITDNEKSFADAICKLILNKEFFLIWVRI